MILSYCFCHFLKWCQKIRQGVIILFTVSSDLFIIFLFLLYQLFLKSCLKSKISLSKLYYMCGVLGKAATSLKTSFQDNAQNGKFYASLSLYLHVFKNSLKKQLIKIIEKFKKHCTLLELEIKKL